MTNKKESNENARWLGHPRIVVVEYDTKKQSREAAIVDARRAVDGVYSPRPTRFVPLIAETGWACGTPGIRRSLQHVGGVDWFVRAVK